MSLHSTKSYKFFFVLVGLLFLAACAEPQGSEVLMPSSKSTCSGEFIKDRYIVKFKNGKFKGYRFADREKFKAEVVEPQLQEIDYIEYDQKFEIAPPTKVSAKFADNVAFSPQAIDNYGLRMIGAASVWQAGYLGQGVVVAVVDSGVDVSHPLLRNQIAYNMGEVGSDAKGNNKKSNGVDDDGNGYVDDYAGFDFVSNTGNMVDTVTHGTHVSGIIAAEHNSTTVSNSAVQGLAPRAKILPVRFLSSSGGTLEGALNSLEYAKRRGAQIINASWGGEGCSRALYDKVKEITDAGIIFVAAAGNNGSNLDFFPEFPAALRFPLQITVGSSGTQDLMSNFSNYSSTLVNLFAPGFNIFSTLPNGQIGAESGTSMAAPYVAAAAAVLLSVKPNATPQEVVNAIYSSVDRNQDFANTTRGRLNVARAANQILN
jgi:subtilisin family serine protease